MNYQEHAPCKGPNCGITNTTQAHSKECIAAHEKASDQTPVDDQDFLSNSKACDLSGEGTCDSCQ